MKIQVIMLEHFAEQWEHPLVADYSAWESFSWLFNHKDLWALQSKRRRIKSSNLECSTSYDLKARDFPSNEVLRSYARENSHSIPVSEDQGTTLWSSKSRPKDRRHARRAMRPNKEDTPERSSSVERRCSEVKSEDGIGVRETTALQIRVPSVAFVDWFLIQIFNWPVHLPVCRTWRVSGEQTGVRARIILDRSQWGQPDSVQVKKT